MMKQLAAALILIVIMFGCRPSSTHSMFYTSDFQEVKTMKKDKRVKVLNVSRVIQPGYVSKDTLWAVEYIVP